MVTRDQTPHPDTLGEAVTHFNQAFRTRYRLPTTTVERISSSEGFLEAWSEISIVRKGGVADASCAVVAKYVLWTVPRYAIGFVASRGRIDVLAPHKGDPDSYLNAHVLLVNPLGHGDNWLGVAAWVRRYGGEKARRMLLAGLASEERPNEVANLDLLRAAAATHGRAIALPPDEAFSAQRAAEVSYIYDVPIDTLRAWKRRYRSELGTTQRGRPPKK